MNFLTNAWRAMVTDFQAFLASPKTFWAEIGMGSKIYFITDTFANIGFVLVVAGFIINQFEVFPLGFRFFAFGMLLMLIGLVGAVVELALGGKSYAIWTVIFCVAVLAVPVGVIARSWGLPLIHDITTDLKTPPQFKAVLALRPHNANGLARAERGLKTKQRNAYPQVRTLRFTGERYHPGKVFEAARLLAREQGWNVVVANKPRRGIVEAVDRSLLMGFRDDIVIRVSYKQGKRPSVLVDMRSVSRFGRGDFGKNAARIEDFLAELKQVVRAKVKPRKRKKRKKS